MPNLNLVTDKTHITPREREMVLLLAEDLDYKSIAKALYVSVNTVRGTLGKVHKRWGVSTGAGVVAHAIRHGLIDINETPTGYRSAVERAKAELYGEARDWVIANCDQANSVPAIPLLRFLAPPEQRALVG